MPNNTNSLTAQVALKRVDQFDFGPIRYKLVLDSESTPWTLHRANAAEVQYRSYLALMLMYPGRPLAPSKEIDAFWHQHILDTEKYAKDCELVFGHFLHHFPYFGIRNDDDARRLEQSFSETKALFVEHFGLDLSETADCTQGSCGTSCSKSCSDIDTSDRIQSDLRPWLGRDGSRELVSKMGRSAAA
jgi:hypothetical protein